MPLGKISKKQEEILEYIKSELLSKGYPPAVREICEAVPFEIYLFCSLSSGDIGEKWLYSPRPNKTACNRDHG